MIYLSPTGDIVQYKGSGTDMQEHEQRRMLRENAKSRDMLEYKR